LPVISARVMTLDKNMNSGSTIRQLAVKLFEARGSDLLRFLRQRLGSEADARDIAQETYLRFIRLGNPEQIENCEAYLFRIATNLLWEHKLRERKLAGQSPLEEPQTAETTPFDLAINEEFSEHMQRVLETLPQAQRAVLILRIRDDCTCAEISAKTGISTSMVKKHLHAALDKCRRRLREYG